MPKKNFKHKLLYIGLGLMAAFVAVYGIVLYSIQDKLLYYPNANHVTPQGQLEVFSENIIPAADGTPILTWYYAGNKDKPAILFFHGNAGQIAQFAPQMLPFTAQGYTVLMMEYRGFGGAAGNVGQQNFYADALTVFDWLKQQNYPQIIIYGYSLGTTMAVNVASQRTADGLILTAPFASMKRLVGEKPIPLARLVLKDYYDSESMIKKIAIPTLLVHGTDDRLIPPHHAEILYKVSPATDKELHLIAQATHVSVYFYEINIPIIFDWLKRHAF